MFNNVFKINPNFDFVGSDFCTSINKTVNALLAVNLLFICLMIIKIELPKQVAVIFLFNIVSALTLYVSKTILLMFRVEPVNKRLAYLAIYGISFAMSLGFVLPFAVI